MKTIKGGHLYQLGTKARGNLQFLQFIEKILNPATNKYELVKDGTTNEEMFEVLIDRLELMNIKLPCEENREILNNLREALMWQNKRAERMEKARAESYKRVDIIDNNSPDMNVSSLFIPPVIVEKASASVKVNEEVNYTVDGLDNDVKPETE